MSSKFKIQGFYILLAAISWLAAVQFGFYLVQQAQSERTVQLIASQLRQELDFSDYNYLARSITDFQSGGSIRCASLRRISPTPVQVLDLKYMSEDCNPPAFMLRGLFLSSELKALNGDVYQFEFVQNHQILYTVSLWFIRLLGIIGVCVAVWAFHTFEKIEKIKRDNQQKISAAIEDVTNQVAHDLRSPLTALQIALGDMSYLPAERSRLINSAIKSILGISADVLERSLNSRSEVEPDVIKTSAQSSVKSLVEVINQVIDSKNTQYTGKLSISPVLIDQFLPLEAEIQVALEFFEVSRMLDNIISNSFESFKDLTLAKVEIGIQIFHSRVVLTIQDNGSGISPENLAKVGSKGQSFKNNGNGLGLYSAKQKIESWGGRLQILSKLGEGTIVSLEFVRV